MRKGHRPGAFAGIESSARLSWRRARYAATMWASTRDLRASVASRSSKLEPSLSLDHIAPRTMTWRTVIICSAFFLVLTFAHRELVTGYANESLRLASTRSSSVTSHI